jgi:diguanylate cyclase (GGDEF)-like protein
LGLKIPTKLADIVCRLIKLNNKKPQHIAVLAPFAPRELFDQLWKGVWSAAFELAPFGVRVERFETDGHDVTAQKRILSNLRAKAPSAIAIVPGHHLELDRDIAALVKMNVPVIAFHTDAPASGRQTYVGTDPAQSGAIAGEVLGRLMGGKGTVASFPGPLQTEHLRQRYVAFRKELRDNFPDMKEAVSHSGYSGLGEAAAQVLDRDPSVCGIYVGCSRSYDVAGVASGLGRRVPFVGFDLTERSQAYLADGTISALIDENVYQQGYLAVHEAFEAMHSSAGENINDVPLRATVLLRANCNNSGVREPGGGNLENLLRIRTRRANRYEELLEEASNRIKVLSETDALTGLLNRSKFEELLSTRAKEDEKLAILMVGLDGFEKGEHSVGQPISDEAMKTVGRILKSLSRPGDYCARIADDEFCILMPGADLTQVIAARGRMLTELAKTVIAPKTLKLGIRVSAGSACLPDDASNAEDLLVHADNAMYAHKRALASFLPEPGDARVPAMSGAYDRFQM